jgi:hypothetical protein
MSVDPCTVDLTSVACTGEDQGREYDVPTPTPSAPAPVPTPPPATIAEVGTVDPGPVTHLAATGVPTCPYAVAALVLVAVGAALRRWAT